LAAEEWQKISVEELIRRGVLAINDGYRVRNSELGAAGIPFVRGGDIGDGSISTTVEDHILFQFADRVQSKLTRPFDVAFITKGTVGRVGIMRPNQPPSVFAPQVCYWRSLDKAQLEPRFLFYLLRSREFQDNLDAVKTHGSMVADYVSMTDQRHFKLTLPPPNDQKGIAEVLGALDDKIELNTRMSETLEAMARALFKSWFVDFDPIRAKAEGRDTRLPKPLADLFPSRLVDSELGQIPETWRVEHFSDTVDIIGGGTPKTSKSEYWNGDIPWFSVIDAPAESDVWVVDTEKRITREGLGSSSAQILHVGTTIITARGTVGRVALVGVPMAMNQSCYGLRGKAGTKGFFSYYAARSVIAELQQRAHGSVFDTITRDTLAGLSITSPTAALVDAFEAEVDPILERIRSALIESRTLVGLRDALLPKLISGELRVKDAERLAVEAGAEQ
jgi:type I restriction enzyme S subunit